MNSVPAANVTNRRLLGLAALAAVVVALAAALWLWSRPVLPPPIAVEALDREVAELITEARAEVLADPRSGAVWGMLGRVLNANQVHLDIALVCFQQAEKLDPENPRWPYRSAVLLNQKAPPDEVIAKLEQATELCDPADRAQTSPRLMLAETLLIQGQTDAAENHLQQVLQLDPENARVHYDLGLAAAARGDWQASRSHLEACLAQPQARGKAASQLASVCLRLSDKKGAEYYAALAARLPKELPWSDPFFADDLPLDRRKRDQFREAEAREAEGTPAGLQAAAKILARLLEEHPKDDLPHLMLGRILGKTGQFERAEEQVRLALALAPDKAQPYYLLSLILFGQAERLQEGPAQDLPKARTLLEESAAAARQALARTPDYGAAHMALGRALWRLGQKTQAVVAMRDAVHCSPEFADNHLFLGLALAEEGKLAEARPHLEQAQLLAGPQDPRARAALHKYFPAAAPSSPGDLP